LQKHFQKEERLISRVLRFYGIGESQIVTDLADLIQQQTNPTIAPYAKPNEVTIRLTVKTIDEDQGIRQLDELEKVILDRVGEFFYGYGEDNSLAKVVVELLKNESKTLTAAESLTAGLFQATIGNVSGVSEVFPGGFVTYSEETKKAFLKIDPALFEAFGTVSKECVEAMAKQARKLAKTDYALAFSGVAGPDELEGHAAGTTWIALASAEKVVSQLHYFSRDRNYIRQSAVMTGLDMVRRELLR